MPSDPLERPDGALSAAGAPPAGAPPPGPAGSSGRPRLGAPPPVPPPPGRSSVAIPPVPMPVPVSSEGSPPAADEPPRRLHPFGIVRGLSLRALLSSLPALLVVGSGSDLGLVALVVLVAVVGAVLRVVAWARHTYELRGGRIIERSGIVSRSERALEIERIQQIDVEQTLLDRAVGTCELRLETAAEGGESELTLTVVTLEEAERLRHVLAQASARVDDELTVAVAGGPDGVGEHGDPVGRARAAGPVPSHGPRAHGVARGVGAAGGAAVPAEDVLVAVPFGHVVLAAVTGPRLLVVPAGIAVVTGVVFEAFRPDPQDAGEVAGRALDAASGLGPAVAALVLLLAVVVAVVGAAIAGVLRDGGFTIVRRGREVVVRRGLTTTRTATVPLRRVQRVTIGRSWVRGLLGFATVTIHTAGSVARGGQGDSQSSLDRSLTVPLLPDAAVPGLVEALLGTGDVPPLARHPIAARRRIVLRTVAPVGLLGLVALGASIVVLGTPVVGGGVLAMALTVGVAAGLARYARMASGMGDDLVAGRTGVVGTRTVLVPRRKVQGVSVHSTPFQRRVDLATAIVHAAGPSGGVLLGDVAAATAVEVRRSLT